LVHDRRARSIVSKVVTGPSPPVSYRAAGGQDSEWQVEWWCGSAQADRAKPCLRFDL